MEEQYQKDIEEKQEFQRYIFHNDVAYLDEWIKTNEKIIYIDLTGKVNNSKCIID